MSVSHPPLKLLFVCLGNICRSPAGENVMRHQVREAGLDDLISVDSAGTAGYHIGSKADPRMIRAAARRGVTMTGRARQFQAADLEEFDWIFAMDHSNRQDIARLEKHNPKHRAKVVMFCEFCEQHNERDVPDPYYGDQAGFDTVLDLLEDGCASFLRRYQQNRLP